ncbi:hypothetical protein BIW11_14211 [Tropilaelaps mercedesae]|uniref:Uncharacterized protein n=1 Tax=Tropilaelaps mercedesae TaxID=418985 RepID=A0A1V9WYX3_9ACAR|nr:hypothetical protein BIW11_14211 [Tropilaelaps mercedesae]
MVPLESRAYVPRSDLPLIAKSARVSTILVKVGCPLGTWESPSVRPVALDTAPSTFGGLLPHSLLGIQPLLGHESVLVVRRKCTCSLRPTTSSSSSTSQRPEYAEKVRLDVALTPILQITNTTTFFEAFYRLGTALASLRSGFLELTAGNYPLQTNKPRIEMYAAITLAGPSHANFR